MKKIIIVILLFFAWKQYYYIETAPYVGAGVLSSGGPYQSQSDRSSFRIGDNHFSPYALVQIDGRVIAASHYYFDRMSRISPMDVVLGWDTLSDESVYDLLDFSTSSRDYEWDANRELITENEIRNSTGLFHLVPADERMRHQLKTVKIGDILVIQGYYVNVKSAAGLKWQSKSTGSSMNNVVGKILYIDQLEIIDPYSRVN